MEQSGVAASGSDDHAQNTCKKLRSMGFDEDMVSPCAAERLYPYAEIARCVHRCKRLSLQTKYMN